MINRRLEEAYNNISYATKEEVGFPTAYIYLTTDQEQFIIDLFDYNREEVKRELLETIDEMREIINDI